MIDPLSGPLETTMRTCSTCGQDWPLSYYKVRHGIRVRHCRDCRREMDRASRARYAAKDPERFKALARARQQTPGAKASHKLNDAVAAGRVIRPSTCEGCGAETKPQGHHHHGYDDPYDVQWLCRPCHDAVHRVLRGSPLEERPGARELARQRDRERVRDRSGRVYRTKREPS